MSQKLTGLGVLVTRPEQQAQAFIQLLEQQGAKAIGFPSIEIQPMDANDALNSSIKQFENFHIIIFISKNAVKFGLKWLENAGKCLDNHLIASIGKSTSSELKALGHTIDIEPDKDFTSEGLLEHQLLQTEHINNKHILIIRGEGGRELLANALTERGAKVSYAEVYRRIQPEADIQPILELWSARQIQLVSVTSNDALKNLYHMMDGQGKDYLKQTALIVPSKRCAELAEQLGFTQQILISDSATNDAMLQTILDWYQTT